MRLNFKKVSAIAASALMVGMTMGTAVAANYPAPFISGGSANVAVVYGTGAGVSPTDLVQAGNIQTSLQSYVTGTTTTTSASVDGEAASLASGTNQIYLSNALNTRVQTLTDDSLSTVLASGTFEDDESQKYDYDQTIVLGARKFTFGDSSSDLEEPNLYVDIGTSTASPLYTATVTFSKAVNFTDADSKGQDIELFGKTYTIGSSTTSTVLQLMGSGKELSFASDAKTQTASLGEDTYEITVNNANTAGTEISVTVNGETKSVTEGSTKKVGGVSVYAKDVMAAVGDTWTATIQLGADELYFTSASAVEVGSDKKDIEGTLVTLTGGTFETATKLQIAVTADDSDVDHILVGEEFEDPVFNTFKVTFPSVVNGPLVEAKGVDGNSDRYKVELKRASDKTVAVALDVKGNEATIEFSNGTALQDDDGHNIEVVEGATLTEDEYYILNSGSYQRIVQFTKISADDDDTADDDVTIKDLFTGEEFKLEDKDLDNSTAVDWSIDGQTYKVLTNAAAAANNVITMTSSDYGAATTRYVYPYIETLTGKDTRIAFIDEVTITGVDASTIIELPTGNFNTSSLYAHTLAGGANETAESHLVGSVYYTFSNTAVANAINVSLDGNQDSSAGAIVNASLLFVEDEDNSDSDKKHAVIIPTTMGATYNQVESAGIVFTATEVGGVNFDDSDYQGNLDQFGTFLVEDGSDSNQKMAWFTYPKEQMYADIYVAEKDAIITGGSTTSSGGQLGEILVKDSEVSSVSSKNLIVVGGSCINSVAAKLLNGAHCAATFTQKTGIGTGQFLIQSFADAYSTGKIALLVAGYDLVDTVNAVTYLKTKTIDTAAGKKYKGTSATSAEVVTTSE